ncbi:MAG: carbohydrate ABC transporter permease, partial [Eubacteriales bacterium]|nr:carbohydrate ABC transporter permease [Eubacteriales bacterium]
MVPLYNLFRSMKWLGTLLPLIVPNFFGNALYIFLLRQFMIGIPKELSDSAIIDGAGHFRILGQIVLPLTKPALFSVALFTFLGNWTDFLGPLVFLNKKELLTLSIGLTHFTSGHRTEWGYLMAACVLFTLPVLLLFFFTQKQFVEGITFTGLKG